MAWVRTHTNTLLNLDHITALNVEAIGEDLVVRAVLAQVDGDDMAGYYLAEGTPEYCHKVLSQIQEALSTTDPGVIFDLGDTR